MCEQPTFVLAADVGFAKQLAAALHSLLVQSTTPSRFVVFHDGFTQSTIDKVLLPQTREETAHLVEWLPVDGTALDSAMARPNTWFTRATFIRLMLPDWLPELRRVVYVDADCVALCDPIELWRTDLRGAPIAAVRHPRYPWAASPGLRFPWKDLGIRPSRPYYNAGVLILDLDQWRSERFSELCFDLVWKHSFGDADQGAINAILGEVCMPLPPRWNVHPGHLDQLSFAPIFEDPELLLEAAERPAIIHFSRSGGRRPWQPGRRHPYADRWYEAIDATGWAGWRPTLASVPPRWYIAAIRGRLGAISRAAIGQR